MERKWTEKAPVSQGTVFDYLAWRGDLTFHQSPFNEVDNLILCIIAYLNFRRVEELKTLDPEKALSMVEVASVLTVQDEQLGLSELDYLPLLHMAAQSDRFRSVKLYGFTHEYNEEKAMQFDAISFLLPDNTLFTAFMGTDTSLAGWKEDFHMSFLSAVPAQERAVSYVTEMAATCPERLLRIGGHSKGGNLAAWAALYIPEELQETRLLAAYNNDGPGFARAMVETPEYRRIAGKLHTYIPESSIVGVLLEHGEDYAVIDSTNRSVMQHEPLSWCVSGTRFVHLGERSQMGKLSDDVLREWIGSMTPQERQQFTDAFFDVLSLSGKARTLDDLRSGGLGGGAALLKQYAEADEEQKRIITEIFRRLAVDVKAELKRATEEGLEDVKTGLKKAAEEGLETMKAALNNLKPEK